MKKNNIKKYIIIAMIGIAIINVFIGISLIFKESIRLKVTSSNEADVTRILKQEIDNVEDINRIELGMGFHSGQLNIYYSNGRKSTLYISEGMFRNESIETYIRENGKELDDVAKIYFLISLIFVILSIIAKNIKMKIYSKFIHWHIKKVNIKSYYKKLWAKVSFL